MTTPIAPDPGRAGPIESRGIPLGPPAAGTPSFSDTLKAALNDVSGLQSDAHETFAAFMRNEPVEIHDLMAAAEEASISLELLVEVRNKLTDAYRTILNMQV